MSKRPLDETAATAEQPDAKRARHDVLIDGSVDELRARLEAAGSVAQRAATFIAGEAKTGDDAHAIPIIRAVWMKRFVRDKVVRFPAGERIECTVTTLEFLEEPLPLPNPVEIMKKKRFPFMSSVLAWDTFVVNIHEDALNSWQLCQTDEERQGLVEFVEEVSMKLARCQETCTRLLAIMERSLALFGLSGTAGKMMLAPEWDAKFARFGLFSIEFPEDLDGQENALSYLQAAARLVS